MDAIARALGSCLLRLMGSWLKKSGMRLTIGIQTTWSALLCTMARRAQTKTFYVYLFTPILLYHRNSTSSYWTNYWHYSYGNCYIFNAGRDKKGKPVSVLKSNKPGPSHGKITIQE